MTLYWPPEPAYKMSLMLLQTPTISSLASYSGVFAASILLGILSECYSDITYKCDMAGDEERLLCEFVRHQYQHLEWPQVRPVPAPPLQEDVRLLEDGINRIQERDANSSSSEYLPQFLITNDAPSDSPSTVTPSTPTTLLELEQVLVGSTGSSSAGIVHTSQIPTTSFGDSLEEDDDNVVASATAPSKTKETICFVCMASALGEAGRPNENCSRDILSVEQAIKLGIHMVACPNGCHTNVLRFGNYITTFRGCYRETLDNHALAWFDDGMYSCQSRSAQENEWRNCRCTESFCNYKLPNI